MAIAPTHSARAAAPPDSQPASPTLATPQGDLAIFPPDNPWNADVRALPVHPRSRDYLASIGLDKGLHADFGTVWNGAPCGIPYVIVGNDTPRVKVVFEYADESDPGPYPIPADPPIEGGAASKGDRHIIIIDAPRRTLYELYRAVKTPQGWTAGSGAIFDLTSNAMRPAGWTSADAAGLPIFPGLVRYDEVMEKGEIRHALRFTAAKTQRAYVAPARHFASKSTDPRLPPMGLRVRLRADFDMTNFPPPCRVILRGLQRHGMILADNGSDWFISGAPDPRWNDEFLSQLRRVKGTDFEAIAPGTPVPDKMTPVK
ncbi:MAG: hypothetical protein NTW19_07270 [Planctomycetota bacterium]|nr:hypothetical protein [Planctomycetota bacterium]